MKTIKVNIAGDLFFGGRFSENTEDRQQAIAEVKKIFGEEGSFNLVNLEAPLTDSLTKFPKTGPSLKASPSCAEILSAMSINAVTLANNHIADYGIKGIEDTLLALKKNDILSVGIEQREGISGKIINHQGKRLAILNFTQNEWSTDKTIGLNAVGLNPIQNYQAIKEVKNKADVVIVICHSGHEFFSYPTLKMKQLFRFFVDAGANAVINHHSHCINGFENYKNSPIFYSLGNFWFDWKGDRDANWFKGIIAQITISDNLEISAKTIHFNQATDALFELCENEELLARELEFNRLSHVIQDDTRLKEEFDSWVNFQSRQYRSYLEPINLRIIKALQLRKILPSFWSRRQKRILLNLIRCESHKEILEEILFRDAH